MNIFFMCFLISCYFLAPLTRQSLFVIYHAGRRQADPVVGNQWLCIARFGCDADTDSSRAMRTAFETSKTKTLRNKGPFLPSLLHVGGQESVLNRLKSA